MRRGSGEKGATWRQRAEGAHLSHVALEAIRGLGIEALQALALVGGCMVKAGGVGVEAEALKLQPCLAPLAASSVLPAKPHPPAAAATCSPSTRRRSESGVRGEQGRSRATGRQPHQRRQVPVPLAVAHMRIQGGCCGWLDAVDGKVQEGFSCTPGWVRARVVAVGLPVAPPRPLPSPPCRRPCRRRTATAAAAMARHRGHQVVRWYVEGVGRDRRGIGLRQA
jgi:hypothetical protein